MTKLPPRGGLPPSAMNTLTRRTLLDWLGKASVLTLGAGVLAACSDGALESSSLEFLPPDEEPRIYDDWPVRTVDQQELASVLASWRLRVDGMVNRTAELSFAELLELERLDSLVDFHCVEGWSVHDVPWNGVHLATLFELVEPADEATFVTFHTIDGRYNESLPLEIALEPRTMLAYGVAGSSLPLRHGFPLRLVVPRLFAYKSAKYVERIELTSEPVSGFWVAAGYPYLGEVPSGRLRPDRF
jgi:DMSO/TMAO reductase YedYZ molybdopterin-dependent catalytic subunit